eukprot:gene13670-15066_t
MSSLRSKTSSATEKLPDENNFVFVEQKANVQIEKLLDDIRKFDPLIANLSAEFEANLILLDREIVAMTDLNRSFGAKRSLKRFIQSVYDLSDIAQQKGIHSDIEQLYIDATLLVEFIYWNKYIEFSQMVLNQYRRIKTPTLNDIAKTEIRKNLEILFFPLQETEEEIEKQIKHLYLFFHPDKVLGDYREIAQDMFVMITELKEILVVNLSMNSLPTSDRVSETEQQAKEAYEFAVQFNSALRLKKGKLNSNLATPTLTQLSQQSERDLIDNKKLHAARACSFYRSLIKMVDKLASENPESAEYLELQIKYRDHIAASFHLGGYKIEAQIYLISAIYLATDLTNASDVIRKLNERLKLIVVGNAATAAQPPSSRNTFNEMSTALVVATDRTNQSVSEKQRKALKKEVKRVTQSFLIENTIRADTTLAEYRAPTDYISQARNTAFLYTTSGALLLTGGTVAVVPVLAFAASVTATEGAMLPVALTVIAAGGVPGLILAGICMVSGLFFGYSLVKSGWEQSKKPERQSLLNTIMTDAMKKYELGAFEEMFEVLSRPYLGQQLIIFEKNNKIEINANNIIDTLLDHGFRCDGIGLILHIIAEGLICSNLNLKEPQGRSSLREEAIKIITILEKNEKLDQDAERLDQVVFESKTKILRKTTQSYSLYCSGIPSSFIKDAETAPFKSRLREVRTISSMNKVILYILTDQNEWAIDNVNQIKNTINQNFQYFTISIYRIEALEDFLTARGLIFPEEKSSSFKDKNSMDQITDGTIKSCLLWGNQKVECLNETNFVLSNNSYLQWYEFFSQLPFSKFIFYNNNQLITFLKRRLDKENEFYTLISSQSEVIIPIPSIITSLNRLLDILNDSNHQAVTINLLKDIVEEIKEIFQYELLICEKLINSLQQDIYQFSYKLIYQKNKHITEENWNNIYFINNDLYTVFQIYPDHNTNNNQSLFIAAQAAISLQKARDSLINGRNHHSLNNIVESIIDYESAIKYFYKALNYFDNKWYYLTLSSSLYQFKEYQNFIQYTTKLQKSSYFPVRLWSTEEIDCIIGLMECYCKIFKFSKTLEIVTICIHRDEMKNNEFFWYWYSIAARKSIYYYDSIFAIQKSLALHPNNNHNNNNNNNNSSNDPLTKEFQIIKKLKEKEITTTVQDYMNIYFQYHREPYRNHNHYNNNIQEPKIKHYDIISIDGGGVKGIIPAYWLSEIEKRTHCPIADLVDMLAGTSTGSAIAGALAVKKSSTTSLPIAARDLVSLYSDPNQLCEVFKSRFSFGGVLGPKYDNSRLSIFKKYVGEIKLSSSCIDLVITAVNESFPLKTHCFNTFDAKQNHDQDLYIYDAIMASSAAPSYFPSYIINHTSYVDGGMQANNPSKLAYDIAYQSQQNPIRIWSLGTGDYISTNQSFNPLRSSFYWISNAYEVAVANQQGQIDNELLTKLDNKYHRWQVWFNQRIVLDDYHENELKFLIEYARQFIEESDDQVNLCVETFLAKDHHSRF